MQGFARVFVVAAASAFTAIGCGSGRGGSGGSLAPAAPDASEKPSAPRDRKPVGVVDAQGRAIAGARVLIGQRQGVPFPNNFVAADGDGKIPAPAEWTSPQPITIEAPGFVRATYYARTPDSGDLILRPLPLAQKIALKGVTTGYGTLADDGWVHVGLVFPALARADIGQFQISNFISSETDSISVAGQTADIPSNVSIPTQRLTYLFFPVTLDKPAFRAFFDRDGAYRMVAAHARFKLSDGVSAIQGGKPFLELVDLLDFKEASLTDVRLSIAGGAANLAVNSIPFSAKSPLTAPRFDSRFAAMALAIGQDSGGRLYPSDVKRIGSGAVRQMAVPSTGRRVQCFLFTTRAGADDGRGERSVVSFDRSWPPIDRRRIFEDSGAPAHVRRRDRGSIDRHAAAGASRRGAANPDLRGPFERSGHFVRQNQIGAQDRPVGSLRRRLGDVARPPGVAAPDASAARPATMGSVFRRGALRAISASARTKSV